MATSINGNLPCVIKVEGSFIEIIGASILLNTEHLKG